MIVHARRLRRRPLTRTETTRSANKSNEIAGTSVARIGRELKMVRIVRETAGGSRMEADSEGPVGSVQKDQIEAIIGNGTSGSMKNIA